MATKPAEGVVLNQAATAGGDTAPGRASRTRRARGRRRGASPLPRPPTSAGHPRCPLSAHLQVPGRGPRTRPTLARTRGGHVPAALSRARGAAPEKAQSCCQGPGPGCRPHAVARAWRAQVPTTSARGRGLLRGWRHVPVQRGASALAAATPRVACTLLQLACSKRGRHYVLRLLVGVAWGHRRIRFSPRPSSSSEHD